jgi:2-C-methyl-D-erythritol 2,4-cyclodiphosphate synthase
MGEAPRVGWGIDAHRLGPGGPLLLAGIVVDADRGLIGTSDADALAHAVADALLGAAALGDLGALFPSSDPSMEGADSMELLAEVVRRVRKTGRRPASIDATIVAETVRVAPHREPIRHALAGVLGLEPDAVSVKGTTTDGLGFLGRDEGLVAIVVAVLEG